MSDRPPPAEGPTPPPVPLTSFIGRDCDIATVTDLLQRSEIRLLTLTGPGGIGKTRLALQVVERLRFQADDRIVVVSLAPVRDADLVLPTIARALQVPDAADCPLRERVTAFLTRQPMLLVLDNLEHLLDAAAPLVAHLLATCPGLTVLATSRARLGISGEQVVPIAPLDPETARALFLLRARAVDPTFAVTAENVPTVDAICDRLDRLPLAIELAAAWVTVLPAPALLARLDQRLDLLSGGPRDAPDRQRDLRATIAWSLDLLTEPEQVLFRRLSVFVGGFSLHAAAAVGEEGTDPLAIISALVAASLINPAAGVGDQPRFTMLETIREYALERLAASDEEPAIWHRHARHLVSLAESISELPAGPQKETESWRLRPEIGNIRLAMEWALEHAPTTALQLAGALVDFWIGNVTLTEGQTWVERALSAAPNAPSRFRARALLAAGWLSMDQDDLAHADTCLTEAIALARTGDDGPLLTMTLLISGQVALKGNDLVLARQRFEEVRAHAVTQAPIMSAMATASLGQVTMALGDLEAAQVLFEEALALHQAGSGPTGIAFGHLYMGQVSLVRDDHLRAATSFREAIIRFAAASGPDHAVRAVEGFAGVVATRWPDRAARLLGAAAAIREGDDWPRDQLEVPVYQQVMATARTRLGETAFTAAWEAGKRLSWDEVLADTDAIVDAITNNADGSSNADTTHGLSPRELEVLQLVAGGASNLVVANALSISERTVENHVHHILDKLGLDSRVAAATWAVRHDLA